MEIDPQLAALLEWQAGHPGPDPRRSPIDECRTAYAAAASLLDAEPPRIDEVRDLRVPGAAGELAARLYQPSDAEGVLLWLHGGGWVQGSLESHDAACRRLAAASKVRVLSLDYRLAPEHPFPAGLEDAVAAFEWLSANGEVEGLSGPCGIGGDSAGASLAAGAAVELVGNEGSPALQVLAYPAMGPELMTDSLHDFGEGFGLDRGLMERFYELYLPEGQSHADPRLSLLLAPDLSAVAPAVVAVAGFDPLRDEALAYAGLLEGSGARVRLLDAERLGHGFLRMSGILESAKAAVLDLAAAIREELLGS